MGPGEGAGGAGAGPAFKYVQRPAPFAEGTGSQVALPHSPEFVGVQISAQCFSLPKHWGLAVTPPGLSVGQIPNDEHGGEQ
jgi:hypothetical protein